jgi:hypothetical protein
MALIPSYDSMTCLLCTWVISCDDLCSSSHSSRNFQSPERTVCRSVRYTCREKTPADQQSDGWIIDVDDRWGTNKLSPQSSTPASQWKSNHSSQNERTHQGFLHGRFLVHGVYAIVEQAVCESSTLLCIGVDSCTTIAAAALKAAATRRPASIPASKTEMAQYGRGYVRSQTRA